MSLLLSGAFDFGSIFSNIVSQWYYYVALLAVILGIILFLILKKPNKRYNLSNTQYLVYIAILTALTTVVNVFTYYPVSYIAISFVSTMCFIAGYTLGAKGGFIVGFMGDLIGAIIFPSGVYNPIIGISNGLMGFIPGVLFDYFKGNAILKTAISAVLCLVICTSGLNTFGLWLIYGLGKKTFWAYLIARLPWQVIVAVVNCAICIGLTKLLPKVLPKNKFFMKEQKQE